MLPLLRIRMKFIFRHKCDLIWTYLLIPLILLLSTIYGGIKFKKNNRLENKEIEGGLIFEDYFLYSFNISRQISEDTKYSLKATTFLANNRDDQIYIPAFIYNETGIRVNCYLIGSNINESYKNLITIKNENGKYRFNLIQNDTNDNFVSNLYYPDDFSKKVIDLKSRDFERSADVFYVDNDNDYNCSSNFKKFLEMQLLLSKYIILKEKKTITNKELKFYVGKNSYPAVTNFKKLYNYNNITSICFSGFISFSLSILTYFFCLDMIEEKEKKIDVFLGKKGMSKIIYFFVWFIIYIILIFFYCLFSTFLAWCINIIYFISNFVGNLLLYLLSLYFVSLFFYTFISSIKYGFIIIKFFNFISPLLGLILAFLPFPRIVCFIFCLIPQINFIFCTNIIFQLQSFPYLSTQKLWIHNNKMSYFDCIIMYYVDIFAYFILFFLKMIIDDNIHFSKSIDYNQGNNIMKIKNLTKKYKNKRGISDLNLELNSNEIFCLLGLNGSGKTTAINIISGFLKPDNGDILNNGQSILNDKHFAEINISVCQQENIIFEYLTVKEYIEYLSEIKNDSLTEQQIDEIVDLLNLTKNLECLCNTLSEGEKRKLNLSLSLITDDNIILLDEPTRGLDNNSKEKIWNFLKDEKFKKDKIIFIGTYDLNEVINIADKVGIIYEGNLIDYGTISYIKEKYSDNIYIYINSEIDTPGKISYEDSLKNKFIEEIKAKYETNLIYKENLMKNTIEMIVPKENKNFIDIFEIIENNGIDEYSIICSSLKDFFVQKYRYKMIDKDDSKLKYSIRPSLGLKQFLKNEYLIIKFIFFMNYNIIVYIVELLIVTLFFYIYIFYFSSFIVNIDKKDLNLLKLLETNPIYIYEYQDDYFKKSDVYSLSKSIKFIQIKDEPYDIQNFISLVYEKSYAHIAKGSLSIKNSLDNTFLECYITYTYSQYYGYFYANTMLIVSSFLKNEYDIDASIFPEIIEKKMYNYEKKIKKPEKISIRLSIFVSALNYLIILSGILYNKINENNSFNIKNLFNYGINKWNYNILEFIFYYFKLLIYNIIINLPILYQSQIAKYIFSMFFLINVSTLIFIYIISYFLPKENRGTKFFCIFALLITYLLFLYYEDNDATYIHLKQLIQYKQYKFTYLDLTPITSMILFLGRLFNSYFNDNKKIALYIDCINQFINIVIYSLILFILEFGDLKKKIQDLQLKIFNILKKKQIQNSNKNQIIVINNPESIPSEPIKDTFIKGNSSNNIISKDNIINNTENNNDRKDYIIDIKGLSKEISNGCCKRVKIFRDYSLNLSYNDLVALLGDNGSGKTILFKNITNELKYEKGTITYNKNDTGYCPQINYNIFNHMKVKDIFKFFSGLRLTSIEMDNSFSEIFDLNDYLDTKVIDLSYSSKRKLMLALALMKTPQLLLLDNPLNGVDFISRYSIWKKMKNLYKTKENKYEYSMLLSTNLVNEAEETCCTIKEMKLLEESGDFGKGGVNEKGGKNNFLYIKLNNSIKNENENINEKVHEEFMEFKKLIKDQNIDDYFNDIISNNEIYYSLDILNTFIKENNMSISYLKIQKKITDILSFYFEIKIIPTHKKIFLENLIKKKNEDKFSAFEFK